MSICGNLFRLIAKNNYFASSEWLVNDKKDYKKRFIIFNINAQIYTVRNN